ncbi:type VI secretion system lipoprotein TssJ [Pseudomonas fluorescens]|uniref:type VI secretion system lipoprotein TssJ n=1 Tax=Pseudomonas fluorescens TaxID=294 RepID=UPI003F9C9FFB
MSRTVGKTLLLVTLATLFAGCGMTQSVSQSTASTARAIFYKQVTTLHLDLSARTAINRDQAEMNTMALPTLVRVYQLRSLKTLDNATYDNLLDDDDRALGSDLLDKHTALIKPGEGAQLDVPMAKDARFVAVVGLFRHADTASDSWRLTLETEELDPDRARVIELSDNRLNLRPLVKE